MAVSRTAAKTAAAKKAAAARPVRGGGALAPFVWDGTDKRGHTTNAEPAAAPPGREGGAVAPFVWEGTDKRAKKMKGAQAAKNATLLRAELRRQGITPTVVKPKPKPLFGSAAKRITAKDIAVFSRQIAP